MKLAFSTLGCPGWSFDEIFAAARDLRFDGVEIRGLENELYAPKAKPFGPDHLAATRARFDASPLTVPMLTSGAVLGVPGAADAGLAEAFDYIDLAEALGTPYIRVMITNQPYPEDASLDACAEAYGRLCDYAAGRGVSPLLETNGLLADSAAMAGLMRRVGRPNAGVLWDIHHPFRYYRETPAVTYQNLAPYVRYVHVKDSVLQDGRVVYRMMGYGDVPVLDCLKLLHEHGDDLFVSLEWVKRWNPDLQEPGIVFSHFINYMNYLLGQL